MRYSPSTKGFYPEAISYPNLPKDLVEVDDKEAQRVQNASAGSTIILKDGHFTITTSTDIVELNK